MVIYRIENTITGKNYIGQTMQTLKQRKREHINRAENQPHRTHKLYMSMRKHGIEAFRWTILETCTTREELNERERFYINMFNSFNRGYNMTDGADAISEETRAKISQANKGKSTATWMHKIIESRRRNGTLCGHIGARGAKSVLSREYIVTEPDGTEHYIHGLREFCRRWTKDKIHHVGLIMCAQGKYSHHHGYKCRYANVDVQRLGESRTPKRAEMGSIPLG